MIKLKYILRVVIISSVMIYLSYCSYLFINNGCTPHDKQTECGTIKSKSNDEVAIKHGSKTELYLNVLFDDRFESILVEPTLYFKYDVGDRVCFDCGKDDIKKFIGCIAIVLAILFIVVSFLFWLFS